MIKEQNRVISLDIMRGIAIFGIFLVNMLSFHSPILYLDPFEWWKGSINKGTYIFIDVFAQGSFYPLFAMLFGYGLVILKERSEAKGLNFYTIGIRRFSLLLVIGIFHAFFIWHGDILTNYAVIGFIFLLFIRMSGKKLLWTGGILYILPNLLLSLLLLVSILFSPYEESDYYDDDEAKSSQQIYQSGTYLEIFEQRFQDWYAVNNLGNGFLMLFTILPLMLIGGGAAKRKWIENTKIYRNKFLLVFLITSICGLGLKLLPYIFKSNLALEYIQDIIGGPLLSIAYATGIALMVEARRGIKLFSLFAPIGKLSLSNYLFQSILSTMLFYSYGLGLYGKVSVFTGTILAIGVYGIQIWLSSYWIKHYYYGPFEWLWRSFTYFKIQKLRK